MRKLLLAITILWLPSVLSSQVLTQHFTKEEIIKRRVSFKNEHLSKRVIKMPSIDTKSIRKKIKKRLVITFLINLVMALIHHILLKMEHGSNVMEDIFGHFDLNLVVLFL